MPSPKTISAVALAFGLLATACGSDGDAVEAPASVEATDATSDAPVSTAGGEATADIKDFVYVPETLEVAVGTTITWTNQDRFGHTVTAGGPNAETGEFDLVLGLTSDPDTTGFTASHTFDEAGTFAYYCRYHPSMVGTVVVTG